MYRLYDSTNDKEGVPMHPRHLPRSPGRLLFTALAALLTLLCVWSAHAQDFGTTTGLLQGERIARVSTVYDGILRAEADTTVWIPFGTHNADLASERIFAPTRFTLFAAIDTAGIPHAAGPSLNLKAQVALEDTAAPYVQLDGSLTLVHSTDPMTDAEVGRSMIVPLYGGGYVRFIAASSDTLALKLDLWRVR
jgi:hypothetical protein